MDWVCQQLRIIRPSVAGEQHTSVRSPGSKVEWLRQERNFRGKGLFTQPVCLSAKLFVSKGLFTFSILYSTKSSLTMSVCAFDVNTKQIVGFYVQRPTKK